MLDADNRSAGLGATGRSAARQLRQLLPQKTHAEYDPLPITVANARKAVDAAGRLVALATRTLVEAAQGSG
jgi:hypothetical protein